MTFAWTGPVVARPRSLSLLAAAFLASAWSSRLTAQTISVYPHGSTLLKPANSNQTVGFGVTGLVIGESYYREVLCTGQVSGCSSPAGDPFPATSQSMSIPVDFTTSGTGTGRVRLWVYQYYGGPADSGWYDITVDGIPPTISLLAPTGDVSSQYPTIQIGWCDNNGLDAASRWIRVNGIDKTSSFNYVGGGPADCVVKATSTTSSVALNLGSNTITAYICDNVPNCTTTSFSITRVTYGVAVTPDGATAPARAANSSGHSEGFTVQNTGSTENTYSLSCGGSANVTCTGLTINGGSVTSVTLASGAPTTVTAWFSTGTVGTGSLTLTASGTNANDAGGYSVPVVTSGAQPSLVDVNSVNAGTFLGRDLCLTISAGPAAAYECGDLRFVHPLPTTRTLNKARTPTLLYNSQTAHPYPLVAANVTLPATAAVPDSVTGTLTIGGLTRARGKWAGSQWTPGQTRRVVLGFDGLNDSTGLYSYTLEIRNWYPEPTASQPTTATGEFAVVNRKDSPFGAGWWLSGLEQFFWIPDGRKLIILGDGSVRVYSAVGANLYTAPNPGRPDTLDGRGTDYVRLAPHGVRVHYSATTGKHIATINRLGHITAFKYDNACGRLSQIRLPPDTTSRVYTFTYTSATDCATRLASDTAPPAGTQARVTTFTVAAGQVTAIQDPDTRSVSFGYDPGFANRIKSRTDRRSNATFYAFDAGGKVAMDSLPLGSGQTPIVQRFRAVESFGLAVAVDTLAAYTRLDGPRVDVADTSAFWLDRFGAPRRIVNALGHETVIKREDPLFAALATELRDPTGFVTRAKYDARGNVDTLIAVNPLADGRDAVTRYHWDARWDFADSVITPTGVTTTMAYDTNGNRLWQQVGSDPARRVTFRYGNAQKLLSSTVLPQTPADSILYDGQWNLAATRTPRGFWTSYYKDTLGRDTLVVTPIDSTDKIRGGAQDITIRLRQRTVFTVMDRDSIIETIAPNGAEEVRVDKRYDFGGNLLSLARVSIPDPTNPAIGTITTQWRYDRANRRVAEVAPDGKVDSTDYDPAGNVVNAVTRRKDPASGTRLTIHMTYDTLNRLVTRVLPQITYQARPTAFVIQHNQGGDWIALDYPAYPIPAETHTFTYDPLGRLLTADNADAKVKRSYYPGGLLQTDSLRIQTVARNDWNSHVYGLRSTYDLDGRRTVLAVPHQLGIGNDTTIAYAYDPQVGLLQSLTDLQRNVYTFGYSLQGDLSSVTYPGSYSEVLGYDADGQLSADTIRNNDATYPRIQSAPFVRAMRYLYDARHKLIFSGEGIQLRDTLRPTYTGLGNLKSTYWTERGCDGCALAPTDRHATVESFTLDAFANVSQSFVGDSLNGTAYFPWGDQSHYQSSTTCCDTWSYQPGTGRMTMMSVALQQPRSFSYDSAGNQEFSSAIDPGNGMTATERASFFAADGSLRMVDARAAEVPHPYQPGEWQTYVVEDYRYDALGRRVWVRARKWCDDHGKEWPAGTECRVGVLRRTIWDGDQELAEIQMPWALQGADLSLAQWDTTQTPPLWENDVTPVLLGRLNTFDTYTGDPNPYFGRVIYAGRRGVDQPIAVTRVNYVMAEDWKYRSNFVYNPARVVAPFTIVPFWNARGDAPVGVFSNGYQALCGAPSADTACVAIRWPWNWSSSDRNGGLPHDYWHGTLLEGKRDGSGFRYMRNRYYDPLTGRFTQEDPIGLAGGLNAYGFAAGDPINSSDPFGLHPCKEAGNEDHDDYDVLGYNPDGSPIIHTTHVDCSAERKLSQGPVDALGITLTFATPFGGGTLTIGVYSTEGGGTGEFLTFGSATGLDLDLGVNHIVSESMPAFGGDSHGGCGGGLYANGCVYANPNGETTSGGASVGLVPWFLPSGQAGSVTTVHTRPRPSTPVPCRHPKFCYR